MADNHIGDYANAAYLVTSSTYRDTTRTLWFIECLVLVTSAESRDLSGG